MAINQRLLEAEATARYAPEVLTRLRNFFHIPDAEIARATGITRQTLANKLNGRSPITLAEAAVLAAYFGVPRDVLFMDPDDAMRWVLDHRHEVEESRSDFGIRQSLWTHESALLAAS